MSMIEPAVTIRNLLAHESAAYRAARLESLQHYPAFFGTTYTEEAAVPILPFEHLIQQQQSSNFVLGAFLDNQLCGICGFKREARRSTRHRGELVQLYVAPAATGRGIGGRLVAAVVNNAFLDLELTQIILGVIADNRAALTVYRRAGFREYGRLERYFVDGATRRTQLFLIRERVSES
jgi:RimJ/RimL family protein N-acetyltransferase